MSDSIKRLREMQRRGRRRGKKKEKEAAVERERGERASGGMSLGLSPWKPK